MLLRRLFNIRSLLNFERQPARQLCHNDSLKICSVYISANESNYKHEEKKHYHNNFKYDRKSLLKSGFIYPFLFGSVLLAKEVNETQDEPLTHKIKIYKSNENDPNNQRLNFNFIADVVDETLPSIVHIEIKQNVMFGANSPSRYGSGFIVSEDGYILTNAHVVLEKDMEVNVKLNDGQQLTGRVVKIDKSADLAIVKVESNNLKPVKLGDSAKVRTGEFVVALGSPLSLSNTVTSGVVSNPNRDGTEIGLNNELFYIQTDTIVTHGNSGGPLVNLKGEVIGINSMNVMPGIAFAIPTKFAMEFMESDNKSVGSRCNYFGMQMITITQQVHDFINSQPGFNIKLPGHISEGCLITEIAPKSPAERAGIRVSDVIIKVNDKKVKKYRDLLEVVNKSVSLKLTLLRNKTELVVDLHGEERNRDN